MYDNYVSEYEKSTKHGKLLVWKGLHEQHEPAHLRELIEIASMLHRRYAHPDCDVGKADLQRFAGYLCLLPKKPSSDWLNSMWMDFYFNERPGRTL